MARQMVILIGVILSLSSGRGAEALPPGNSPNSPELTEGAYEAFQKFCVSCHGVISNRQAVIAMRSQISLRLRWLEDLNQEAPDLSMPPVPNQRRRMLRPENAELLAALIAFIQPQATE